STGDSKYIPVTGGILRGNRRAVLDLLCFHLRARPDSRIFGGKNFMLGGNADLERLADGVRAGDMSGIASLDVPRWIRAYYFPPPELTREADWEKKVALQGERSLREDIRAIGG